MNALTTPVPAWVSVLFILTFPAAIFLIANAAERASQQAGLPKGRGSRIWWGTVSFYGVFLAYTSAMSAMGFFDTLTLPPPIFLFTTIPLLVFLLGYVARTAQYQTLLKHASLQSLIRIHIFRFVGVFFLIHLWYDALPQRFALLAGMGDIITATLAIWVASRVEQRKPGNYLTILVWNSIGLLDILSVLVTGILTANQATAGNVDALRLANIADNPFCWIPAVAPATIIFLHIGIFRKLKQYRDEPAARMSVTSASVPAADSAGNAYPNRMV